MVHGIKLDLENDEDKDIYRNSIFIGENGLVHAVKSSATKDLWKKSNIPNYIIGYSPRLEKPICIDEISKEPKIGYFPIRSFSPGNFSDAGFINGLRIKSFKVFER